MNLRLLLNVPDSHYSRNTTAAKTSATSPHNTVAHFRSSSKLQPIMPWRPLGPNMAMQGMKKSMDVDEDGMVTKGEFHALLHGGEL